MPRDLSDVLHYFIPELSEFPKAGEENPPASLLSTRPQSVLPILTLPISDQDVVRAAFAWNLGVEISRLGGRCQLVAPPGDQGSPLWPNTPGFSIGTEVLYADGNDLQSLHRKATDVAVALAADADNGGIVLVRVPPVWLRRSLPKNPLLRWVLLFTSPDPREMAETFGLARLFRSAYEDTELGVTFHGVKEVREAEAAFDHLESVTRRRAGIALSSYGALLNDLEVYRAIVAHRAVSLAHPQSPAAHALHDVATMLLRRARETGSD